MAKELRSFTPPLDPGTQLMQSQEPRSLVIPPERPSGAQNVGLAVADIPSRLIGGDAIRVDAEGFSWSINLDIAELEIAQGQPNEQWLPVWVQGTSTDEIRRVAVNAIPADAPHDDVLYGRLNGHWEDVSSSVTIAWDDVRNKPDTFPPTLPIPSSGVTGLDTHLGAIDAKDVEQDGRLTAVETKNTQQDGRLTTIEGVNTSQDAAIAANTTAITGLGNTKMPKPATTPVQNWVARSDGTWAKDPIQADPPNDGLQYARKGDGTWAQVTGGAVISDTPPASPLPNSFWWESDSGILHIRYDDSTSVQWVAVNSPGLPDAPTDGNAYLRSGATWKSGGLFNDPSGVVISGASGLNVTNGASITGPLTVAGTPTFNSNTLYSGGGAFTIGHQGGNYWNLSTGGFWPLADNAYYCGKSGNRFFQVWAGNATIQTSDENDKRDIRSLDEKEKTAAQAMKGLIVAYRWKPETLPEFAQSEAEKISIGVIAQRIEECLRDAGLDPTAYSMWRRDELEGGGYHYSVDYNQVLAFIIGGL